MLEEGYINSYDQALQKGFEIGVSEAVMDMLVKMARRAKIYVQKHPDYKSEFFEYYDKAGNLLKEKWAEKQISLMECWGLSKVYWNDICIFAEKYPNLSSEALARRIIRESEYKYI